MNHYYTEVIGSLINVMKLNEHGDYEHICFVPLFEIPQMAESGYWDEENITVGIVSLATYLTHIQTYDENVLVALRNLVSLLFLVEIVREAGIPLMMINGNQQPVTAPITRLFLALSAEENILLRFGAKGIKEMILTYQSMLTEEVPPKLTIEGIDCLKKIYQSCLDAIDAGNPAAIATRH